MIACSVQEGRRWHCGAIIRRLRSEQKAIAIGLGADLHRSLWEAMRGSGISRAWLANDGQVLALMGVSGPLMASEGTVWLALSEEAVRHPIQIMKQARRQLNWIMMFKHRLYADPFVLDPASVRFARRLGFVEIPPEDGHAASLMARAMGCVPMALTLNMEAYVGRRAERVN